MWRRASPGSRHRPRATRTSCRKNRWHRCGSLWWCLVTVRLADCASPNCRRVCGLPTPSWVWSWLKVTKFIDVMLGLERALVARRGVVEAYGEADVVRSSVEGAWAACSRGQRVGLGLAYDGRGEASDRGDMCDGDGDEARVLSTRYVELLPSTSSGLACTGDLQASLSERLALAHAFARITPRLGAAICTLARLGRLTISSKITTPSRFETWRELPPKWQQIPKCRPKRNPRSRLLAPAPSRRGSTMPS